MKTILMTLVLLMLSNISYATMLAIECGESVYFDEEEEFDVEKCDNEGRASLTVKTYKNNKAVDSENYQCTCMAS